MATDQPRNYRSIRQLLDEFGILRGESLDRMLKARSSSRRGRTTIWQSLYRAGKLDRPTLQIIEITREGRITPEVARMCLKENAEKRRSSGQVAMPATEPGADLSAKSTPPIAPITPQPKPAEPKPPVARAHFTPIIRRKPASKMGLLIPNDATPARHPAPLSSDSQTRNVAGARTELTAEASPSEARPSERRPSNWSPTRNGYCGRMVGRYLVSAPIGRGAMSDVFVASDTRNQQAVALKILKRAIARFDDQALVRFRAEAEALRRVDSPHVVAPIDLFEDEGTWVLAMEHVPGLSVGELIDMMGSVQEIAALRIVRCVARGLEAALRVGIIHRDVKPHNILINGDGVVKVCDFGLAMVPEAGPSASRKTHQNIGLGTPMYCSPEQAIDAATADHRSDIYSLGVTLYQMLVGQPPFVARSAAEMMLKHSEEMPEHIDVLGKSACNTTLRLLARMMAKDPADRPQTYAELLGALQGCETEAIAAAMGN